MPHQNRRDFIKKTALVGSIIPFVNILNPLFALENVSYDDKLSVHIFSKHLQFLDYKETGAMASEMGFNGVDLTVRPNGHVLPESVVLDLPKAITEIKEGGAVCKMITTSIGSVENPLDVQILNTASTLGIEYYRTNWFKFKKDLSLKESLNHYQNEIKKLGELNKKLGVVGCYQNHAGTSIGASFWEIHEMLKTVNPDYFGTQYDIRHAIVEGGFSWENGFQLLHPKIKTIVLKDFKWGKVNGQWKPINVPMGDGMVDFSKYFKLLKKHKLNPPVSLHLEYDLGGAEKGHSKISIDKKVVYDAMKRDLNTVQKLWQSA
ncbi:TIM barrel protein [Hyunsoonleella sp. SJ7]|uniref:TIM barrel protein n=1 Tax=Hyunsoonleella aquatilis TaxID=2762758 RepID=A0A923HIX8_9FLAO|nr:sugar phosphate isomerase/epimerase family protein [Hyunsoonleella aquatilis]MBC3759182.1 TIM barrel protein [Hyunsoonleella aquatilis]